MIVVCPLSATTAMEQRYRPSHAISLLGPDMPHRSFETIPAQQHLRLTFHDISQPMAGYAPPGQKDAQRLLSFIQTWPGDEPLLIHCWAGISRSTAAAYVALCLLRPDLPEHELAAALRDASPSATPNRLIVSLADGLLGRDGRMSRAIEGIGRGADAFEGTPFELVP